MAIQRLQERHAVPTVADVVGPGIEAMVTARPTVLKHLEKGRYHDHVAGWKGQFAVEQDRIVEEVAATRTGFATGQALTELCSSEFETDRTIGALAGVGEVTFARSVVHFVGTSPLITSTDAIDEQTFRDLYFELITSGVDHFNSTWSSGTGTG